MFDLFENEVPQDLSTTVNLEKIQSKTVSVVKKSAKTIIRDLRRKETAKEAIAEFDKDVEVFGFTKGQFSLCDLAEAIIEKIGGKAELIISTWTAAHTDVTKITELIKSGKITSTKWLVDISLQRRTPSLTTAIRQQFGEDAIKIAKNHAKFMLLKNENWNVVCRTSMNLNYNPRFEDFTISDNIELYGFINTIIDEIWSKQPSNIAEMKPYEQEKFFYEFM